jgi:hypothetical protein
MKFLCNPPELLANPIFLWKMASVDTSRLLISTCHFPMATGVALDGGFLLLP